MLKKLLKEIFKQKGIYFLLFVGFLDQIFMVSLPYFGKIFIDFIESGNIGTEFYYYLAAAICAGLCGITMGSLSNYIKSGIISRYEIIKNEYYFRKFFALDFEYRNSEGTGKTITKINRGIDSQLSLFQTIIESIFIIGIRASIILFIIFTVYKSLILLLILIAVTIFFFSRYISKKIKVLTEKDQKLSEEIGKHSNKMIMESNLIKVSNREEYEINNLKNIFADIPAIRQKIVLNNNITYDLMHAFFQIIEFSSYLVIGMLVIKGDMSLGELFLIITYVRWLWRPISIIITNASAYRNNISKYEALEAFVNQENKVKDGENIYNYDSGTIIFKGVDFSYNPVRSILKNFSLTIEGGKTTALVGHSGSGKSTIIKLLLRNYLVNGGEILIDNQNITDIQITSFYDNIGYLSQEPAVFDGTIKENLEYSKNGNITEDELWDALKQVDLYDIIKNSKEGLLTEIGEKGLKLSGGEKQRLAIARIFIKNPKILILDEPTSALDSISEHKITQLIHTIMENRTVIVIAHRLQTVLGANKIIVLEKGEIIEAGKHEELLQQNGVYAKLVDLQRGIITD